MKYLQNKYLFVFGLIALSTLINLSPVMAEEGDVDEMVKSEDEALLDSLVPTIYPGRNCLRPNLKIPKGLPDYTIVSNRDCSAYYVLPPKVYPNAVQAYASPNLRFCTVVDGMNKTLLSLTRAANQQAQRLIDLSSVTPTSEAHQERLSRQIEMTMRNIDHINQEVERTNSKLATWEKRLGATFNFTLLGGVNDRDLDLIAEYNSYPSETQGMWHRPVVIKAPIYNSTYSFTYVEPQGVRQDSSIYDTTIPGLEILKQPGSMTRTAHVKANGALSGSMRLRLGAVCGFHEEVDENQFVIKNPENNFSPLVVNHNYEMQKRFTYGYQAQLIVDEVTNSIVEDIIKTQNKGFTKEQIFQNTINSGIESHMSFDWENDFSTSDHNYTSEMIQEVKVAVFQRFVDDYFEKLVQSGSLEIIKPQEIETSTGGYADVSKVGTRCWTNQFFFRRTRNCTNYTYKVSQWHDGLTKRELENALNYSGDFTEVVTVREMIPFHYTSTFDYKSEQ